MCPGRPVANLRSSSIRASVIGIAAMALISQSASAQSNERPNAFQFFFGERSADVSNAPQTDAFPTAAPPLTITITPKQYSVGSVAVFAYCVRLCDGRYFPLPLSSGSQHSTPLTLCKALCPASKTRIYIGTDIDGAFATNGSRYSGLDTAFRYRKELIAGCTCNGRDVLGTATIVIAEDPTLRAGDIIATSQGLQVFTGAARITHRAKDFRPIEKYPRLSASLRTKVKW